jgi:hypothetical protein
MKKRTVVPVFVSVVDSMMSLLVQSTCSFEIEGDTCHTQPIRKDHEYRDTMEVLLTED